jgi:beta-galactosidase
VEEAAQIGRELEIIGQRLVATHISAHVALVSDYDNEWDGELDSWHGPYTRQSILAWFAALQYQHIPVDALSMRPTTTLDDIAKYRVLVYPHPAILTDATADLLSDYVRLGGTIVFGARTGYKDATGQCPMRPFPGAVASLCGITVADFTRIGPYESAPTLRWRSSDGPAITAEAFNDVLQVEASSVEVLAEYAGSYYAGAPALVRNSVGNGSAYYYGAVFNVDAATALIARLGLAAPVGAWLELPQPVELCIRARPESGERLIFLLNYSAADQTITLHKDATDALSGARLSGSILLEPFGVRILSETDEYDGAPAPPS